MTHFIDNIVVEQTTNINTLRYSPTILTVASQTTQLTLASPHTWILIGSTLGQIIRLPDATTVATGHVFNFWNDASVAVTIQNFSGTNLYTLTANSKVACTVRDVSTLAGIWITESNLSVQNNGVLLSNKVNTLNFALGSIVTDAGNGKVTIDNNGVYYRIAATETQLIASMAELNTLGGGAIQLIAQISLTANRTLNFNNIRWIGATSTGSALKLNGYILTIAGGAPGSGGAFFQNVRFLGENGTATGFSQNIINTDITNYPLYVYFDNCFFKNIVSKDTETYADVSGGLPNGAVLDLRNGATSCIFENCDFHSDAVSDLSTTDRMAPMTVWAAQGRVTRIASVGNYTSYSGRNRYRILPPYGTASTGTYIGFATDGTAIHYGPIPTVTQGICQQISLNRQDSKSLYTITSGTTLDLTSPSANYAGDGLWVTDASSGAVSFTLPPIKTAGSGFYFTIYKKGANTATVNANSGQTINGSSSYVISGTNVFITIYYDAANTNWLVDSGGTSGSSVFGTYAQFASSDGLSSTTSTSWVQKLRLTTPSLPAGTYRIGWMYDWSNSSSSSSFQGQVQLDDTTTLMSHQQEPKDIATSQRQQVCGFIHIGVTAGVHNIDLDYSGTSGGATSRIQNARLEIWRVS